MKQVNFDLANRKKYILYFVCLIILIYIIQLFKLQVLDTNYKQWADSNALLNKKL